MREAKACILAIAIWLAVTILFIGFRLEHILLAVLIVGLFFISRSTRRLVVALIPFILFGVSYDWMNLCPNYMVNPVDVEGIYNAEKSIFGISTASGEILTPNEFFALHTTAVADFFSGVFYLCWVPVPIFFGLWMYFKGRKVPYLHFSIVFLLVNLIGFTVYYIHPAAPPWYVALYGFDVIPGTPGNVAGMAAFDQMTGLNIFDMLYTRNSNVFAAVPSLHSAYTLVALIYAVKYRASWIWRIVLAIITVGIWCAAVYTSHHYVIDVLLGICCAFAGFALFEFVFMRIPAFKRFMTAYAEYIK